MPRPSRRGAIAVYVVITMLLLIGFLGLAVDTAHVRTTAQKLQAAADAAALAAAGLVMQDDPATDYLATRQKAVDIALANSAAGAPVQLDFNMSNSIDGDVVVGQWNRSTRVFTPTTLSPDAVMVQARRTSTSIGGEIGLFFGAVFGQDRSGVARPAVAQYGTGGGAAVLVLDPSLEGAFDVRGNPRMRVPRNDIQVNSTDACAMMMNGAPDDPRVQARRINVTGNFCIPDGSASPAPVAFQPPIPDPLEGIPQPDPASMPNLGGIRAPGVYDAGYYPTGLDCNDGVVFLNPGVYVFGPPGVEVHGDCVLQGSGVMLFVDMGARIVISGDAPGLDFTPPTAGLYRGISIFQHRDNTLACDISGSGLFNVPGTMYFKRGHLGMDGNVDRSVGRVITNTLLFRGNGRYTITGEGRDEGPMAAYLVD